MPSSSSQHAFYVTVTTMTHTTIRRLFRRVPRQEKAVFSTRLLLPREPSQEKEKAACSTRLLLPRVPSQEQRARAPKRRNRARAARVKAKAKALAFRCVCSSRMIVALSNHPAKRTCVHANLNQPSCLCFHFCAIYRTTVSFLTFRPLRQITLSRLTWS